MFKLTVTDNSGASADDYATVVVNNAASPGNQAPNAKAGDDITIQFGQPHVLNGSGSTDSDGQIVSYKWVKDSGPSNFTLVTPNAVTTELRNAAAGTYVFKLTVTDD